jgi:hypothetical protein
LFVFILETNVALLGRRVSDVPSKGVLAAS